MIVVCDINEVWRRKPFAALAEIADTLGVAPADWRVARTHPDFKSKPDAGALNVLPVALPPGWASRTAWLGQRLLWHRIRSHARSMGREINGLVVTSPHYLPLLDLLAPNLKTIYYASDDYHSYEGWDRVLEQEQALIERVDHAFFVSEGLMERTCSAYGIRRDKVSVSMNATEARFFQSEGSHPAPPPCGELQRPIIGVVGGINERLDFDLLLKCADMDRLGTLLLVGPVPVQRSGALERLLEHHNCVAVGAQPHDTIHQWFQCLDVGLIPYVKTEFNRLCSPMRLFDHLASRAALVVSDACGQVDAFRDRVAVCGTHDEFLRAVDLCLDGVRKECAAEGITWPDRARNLLTVMKELKIV